ncbi:hypothetical protein DFA_01429 [Cavenderia fasciculata]|uniref:AP complex mu/sigma subunit domain-containing protein n=1 Tax=Cavenderia fasciculata TaxID=261658 RepID=F4PSR5_CACFS|nr:uncharacterized protein DFA_01429 [Cavenderia fasciculata]EGG21543.1 hypothetical protein DFA_01429 [Cavenderia fasciculata]|eukprot:XP_004359393.1 hypothetical protein DFA_01429 [Cavenderia fasciculata]
MDLLYQVKAVIIMDTNGKRICSTFYDQDSEELKNEKSRRDFELKLHQKSKGTNSVGCKTGDVVVFVVGKNNDSLNELALADVLQALLNCMRRVCQTEESNYISKKGLLSNYSTLVMYIDEVISDGIIFEVDEEIIAGRTPVSDQSLTDLNNAIETAKEKFALFTGEHSKCPCNLII